MKRKRRSKLKLFIIVASILILLTSILYFSSYLSVFSSKQITMTQYAGTFDQDEFAPSDVANSMTAKFGDYTIITEKTEYAKEYSDWKCESNTCNGVEKASDADGCTLWEAQVITYDVADCAHCYVDTSGMSSNTRIGYQQSCNEAKAKSNNGCSKISTLVECGGLYQESLWDGRGCWGKYTIKNGPETIYQSEHFTTQDISYSIPFEGSGSIDIIFKQDSHYSYATCQRIQNSFSFIVPEEAFILNLDAPQAALLAGDKADVKVMVTNNFLDGITANLNVHYEVPTTIGSAEKDEEYTVELIEGHNEFSYQIPTDMVTEKVIITAHIDVLLPGSYFSGVNGICYQQDNMDQRSLGSCQYVLLGSTAPETYEATIMKSIPSYCIDAGIEDIVECNLYINDNIGDLLTNIAGQEDKIKELSEIATINAQVIADMEANIETQVATIKALELNAAEKEQMIGEMREIIENSGEEFEFMLKSIDVLEIDNDELRRIINNYDSTLEDDAQLIGSLDLTNDELIELISGYKGNVEKEKALVEELKKDNADLITLLDDYEPNDDGAGEESDNLVLLVYSGVVLFFLSIIFWMVLIIRRKKRK